MNERVNSAVCIRYIILLIVLIFFSLKYLQSTPVEDVFFRLQAVFFVAMFFFLFVYFSDLFVKHQKPDFLILYTSVLAFSVPIFSAMRSNDIFGQPYIYGLAAERNWLSLIFCIWLYYVVITERLTYPVIEKIFLLISGLSLVVFTFLKIYYSTGQVSTDSSFVVNEQTRGVRLRFQYFFIDFGLIYLFIKSVKSPSFKVYAALMAYLIFALLVVQGRVYILTMAFVFLIISLSNLSFARFILFLFRLLFCLGVILLILNYMKPSFFDSMSELYLQMFKALISGVSEDDSSNARLIASDIILNQWGENLFGFWFGSGTVSHQFNDGYQSIFGYFYPADVGLLGGVFLYGVLGTVFVYLFPMFFMVYKIKQSRNIDDIFIMSQRYLLIYYLINPNQGGLFFSYVQCYIPFFLITSYLKINER